MKALLRNILTVCALSTASSVYAQLPTADQVGLYSGKGTFVSNIDLDSPKLIKERASFVLLVNADGSVEMQIILTDGGPPTGLGDGVFGSGGVVYRAPMAGFIASGRLSFKGKSTKLGASGSVNLLTSGFYPIGEGTLKLKKVAP